MNSLLPNRSSTVLWPEDQRYPEALGFIWGFTGSGDGRDEPPGLDELGVRGLELRACSGA